MYRPNSLYSFYQSQYMPLIKEICSMLHRQTNRIHTSIRSRQTINYGQKNFIGNHVLVKKMSKIGTGFTNTCITSLRNMFKERTTTYLYSGKRDKVPLILESSTHTSMLTETHEIWHPRHCLEDNTFVVQTETVGWWSVVKIILSPNWGIKDKYTLQASEHFTATNHSLSEVL
jgi:hypothetical protein